MRNFTTLTRVIAAGGVSLLIGVAPDAIHAASAVPSRATTPVPAAQTMNKHLWVKSVPNRFEAGAKTLPAKAIEKVDAVTQLPFYDDFSDGDATRERYTMIDLDNDGYGDGSSVKNCWFWKEDEQLIQFCTDNSAAGNDWLISPPIHLDGKNIYNVEIVVNMGAESNLKLTIGTSPDPATHREIKDLNAIWDSWQTPYDQDFSVSEEGDYYIGLYNYSSKDSFYFNLFSLQVTAGISSEVPQAPSDFTITPGAEGALTADVSIGVPAALANGTAINGDVNLLLYRNGVKVQDSNVAAGSTFNWTDESPVNGENTYMAFVKHNGHDGMSVEKTVWVGADTPASPQMTAFKTTNNNMNVVIEWTAVETGSHPGVYFNPAEVTYTVYRGYSSKEMTPIAANITDTRYVDTDIAELVGDVQSSYFYAVAACTPAGEGKSSADIIAVGKPYAFPQQESFPNGNLNLSPWLTDPITGSFSWECSKDDTARGVGAQDNDNGLTRFQSWWGGETDSRLISPVFTLAGSKNPMLSLYMFHWEASSVAADYGATRMFVEISCDGGPFEPLSDVLPAGYDSFGWMEHRFPLAEYKDAETVQFAFRGQTDNSWMYFYIDNIHFEEQCDHDLAIESFYGPGEVKIDQESSFSIQYLNRGLETADDYSIDLYKDGQLIQSVKGESLQSGESKTIAVPFALNAAQIHENNEFYVELNYKADTNLGNNVSTTIQPSLKTSFYPQVTGLTGTEEDGTAVLSWTAPELPGLESVTDGAEDYQSFTYNNFGEWTTYDGDRLLSGYDIDLPEWPGRGGNQAFMIWAPWDLDGFDFDTYSNLVPFEGSKCYLAWLANLWDDWFPINDDYLISPEVTGGTDISFMIKGILTIDMDESYDIMYSTTGSAPTDFTVLESGMAKAEWEEVKAQLPADARYFCIHYTGCEQMGIMVDNVQYVPVAASLKIEGYNVFRNGEKINTELVKNTTFTDTDMAAGENIYRVAAVYDRGTSNAGEAYALTRSGISQATVAACPVSVNGGVLTVNATEPMQLNVYGLDGKAVISTPVYGGESFTLSKGFYLIEAGNHTLKVII